MSKEQTNSANSKKRVLKEIEVHPDFANKIKEAAGAPHAAEYTAEGFIEWLKDYKPQPKDD